MTAFEKLLAGARWLGARFLAAVGAVGALSAVVLAFVLRRRTEELREARVEATEQKENAENQKLRDEITALEGKAATDAKDSDTKEKLLLAHLLDDGRPPGPRE
jgi:HAMP domain-containing protein